MKAALPVNLLADTASAGSDEIIDVLVSAPGLRIERIVSNGHASPPGFHYDQPHAEWVTVLVGSADLRFEDEPRPRRLKPGDHLMIAAHRRHRVERSDAPTVWLAVHFDSSGEPVPED